MENNLDNKAIFFAQYYGQNVWTQQGLMCLKLDYLHLTDEYAYLELRSLSNITNEEVLEVAWMRGYKKRFFDDIDKNTSEYKYMLNEVKTFVKTIDTDCRVKMYQYLQSRGFALPYMDLSIEQLIEYGWVKLAK